jgi:hypothetical protein
MSKGALIEHLLEVALEYVLMEKKFFVFYNGDYYRVKMKAPYFGLHYAQVPLPGQRGYAPSRA